MEALSPQALPYHMIKKYKRTQEVGGMNVDHLQFAFPNGKYHATILFFPVQIITKMQHQCEQQLPTSYTMVLHRSSMLRE